MTVTWWGLVDLTVEVALTTATGGCGIWDSGLWDESLWGPDETWVDVTQWVRSIETKRGFSAGLRSWSAGTANIVLDNRDGRFSPDNLDAAAPYVVGGVTGVRPGRPVRVRMAYAGVTYYLYRGYVGSWDESSIPAGPRMGDATMVMSCEDEWARLSASRGFAIASAGAGETCGPRWARILASAGHTGTTDLAVGTVTLQATDLSTDPVRELGITADSEGGWIYVEADGTVTGRDQYAVVEDPRCTTVQATFGDGGGSEIPWTDVDTAPVDLANTVNIATYKRVGGTDQRYADATSRALYGDRDDRSPNITALVCETDAQALALATRAVATQRSPEARVNAIKICPRADPTTRIPVALGLRIRDLVEVIRRPPSAQNHTMTRACFVSGIRHKIDPGGRWETTFDTSSATAYRAFATSVWDVGTWGASEGDPTAALWFY